jgi:hypothetical protein
MVDEKKMHTHQVTHGVDSFGPLVSGLKMYKFTTLRHILNFAPRGKL